MHPAFYILWYLQGALATLVALYGTWVWLTDREDIVTRYVMRAGTAGYLWLFSCALLVALVPA